MRFSNTCCKCTRLPSPWRQFCGDIWTDILTLPRLRIGPRQGDGFLHQIAQSQTVRYQAPPLEQGPHPVNHISRPLIVPADVRQDGPDFVQIGPVVLKRISAASAFRKMAPSG
jgi:hypothetical protein